MEQKYILTEETVSYKGHILHRIEALRDFGDVKKGDKGGWIEKEDNLSHEGNCWVGDEANVYGDALVFGDARVYGNAQVYGKALVSGEAQVYEDARVFGDARVYGKAWVLGNAQVYGDAQVYADALVSGNAFVHGNARVYSDALVYGDAHVYGDASVFGRAEVCGDAVVKGMGDYIVFQNWWSSGRYFTYTKSNGMWKVGCFYGTGEELIKKAYADGEEKGRMYEKIVNLVSQLKGE